MAVLRPVLTHHVVHLAMQLHQQQSSPVEEGGL